jgi:hypothetical protein
MKINEGFALRKVCDENVIVAFGRKNIDFSKVISLNESAAYLWNAVVGREFTSQEMADLLCKEYDVDAETALNDVTEMLESWKSVGLIS